MKFKVVCCLIVASLVSTSSYAISSRKLRCQSLFSVETESNPFGELAQQYFKMEDVSNGVRVEIVPDKKVSKDPTLEESSENSDLQSHITLPTRIVVRDERTNTLSFEYEQPGATFVKALTPYSVLVGTAQGILVLAIFNPETKSIIRRIVLSPVSSSQGRKDKLYPRRIFAKNIRDGKFLITAVLTNYRIVSIELNVDSYDRSDYIHANYID